MNTNRRIIPITAALAAFMIGRQLNAAVVNITSGSTSGYTMTDGNTYVVTKSLSFSSTSASGMSIADGATAVLYIPKDVTLTVSGSSGSGQVGAGAGIRVPQAATLVITGEGTVSASGGKGGNGTNGANGGNGQAWAYWPWPQDSTKPPSIGGTGGAGGSGGSGGGGAGAGIGGGGGTGGGAGGRTGHDGEAMGTVYILGSMTVRAHSGSGGSSGKSGTAGTTATATLPPGDYPVNYSMAKGYGGGGGGGGIRGAAPTYAIGGGGAGGGGGNNGGNGYGGPIGLYYDDPGAPSSGGSAASGEVGNQGTLYLSSSATVNVSRSTKNATTHPAARYSISFDANGGTLGSSAHSVTTTLGCALPSLDNFGITTPTKNFCEFLGWATERNGGTLWYGPNGEKKITAYPYADDTTLYAQWGGSAYSVTFDLQGGCNGTVSIAAIYGSAMPNITVPTRVGYTFGGYYTAANGGGTQYYTASGTSARTWDKTADVTLYAKWTANTFGLVAAGVESSYDGLPRSVSANATSPGETVAIVHFALTEDGPYSDANPSFTDAGTNTVWIVASADGHVPITNSAQVVILPKPLSASMVCVVPDQVYDGTPKTPMLHIRDGWPDILSTEDYTIRYEDNVEIGMARIVVEGCRNYAGTLEIPFAIEEADPERYLVVDLSGGTGASTFPVSYLSDIPSGGWTDEYKTTKFVLRKVREGTFNMGSPETEVGRGDNEPLHHVTLTHGFYIGVFETTQKQWELVMGTNPSQYPADNHPVEKVSYDMIRGADAGAAFPANNAVDAASFLGVIRAKTGVDGFDLPTEAQWEYACRAGTETALNSGKELEERNGFSANLVEICCYEKKMVAALIALSDRSYPTAGDFLICMGTYGSGALTGIHNIQSNLA